MASGVVFGSGDVHARLSPPDHKNRRYCSVTISWLKRRSQSTRQCEWLTRCSALQCEHKHLSVPPLTMGCEIQIQTGGLRFGLLTSASVIIQIRSYRPTN